MTKAQTADLLAAIDRAKVKSEATFVIPTSVLAELLEGYLDRGEEIVELEEEICDLDLDQVTEAQLEAQGVACYRVSDGQVFVFSEAVLAELLTKARESGTGKAILFVRRGAEA